MRIAWPSLDGQTRRAVVTNRDDSRPMNNGRLITAAEMSCDEDSVSIGESGVHRRIGCVRRRWTVNEDFTGRSEVTRAGFVNGFSDSEEIPLQRLLDAQTGGGRRTDSGGGRRTDSGGGRRTDSGGGRRTDRNTPSFHLSRLAAVLIRRKMAQEKCIFAEQNVYFYIQLRNALTSYDVKGDRFTEYEITIQTNSIAFTLSKSMVKRRYSEFVWFREKLKNDNGVLPPILPPKSYFNRFNDVFIKQRKLCLQEFLENLSEQTVFLSDSCLHLFLQTQLPIPEIEKILSNESKLSISEAIIQDHCNQELCVDKTKCHIISHALHGPQLCCWNLSDIGEDVAAPFSFKRECSESHLAVIDGTESPIGRELSSAGTWGWVTDTPNLHRAPHQRRHTVEGPAPPETARSRSRSPPTRRLPKVQSLPDISGIEGDDFQVDGPPHPLGEVGHSGLVGRPGCEDRLSLCEDRMNNIVFDRSVEKSGKSDPGRFQIARNLKFL